LVHTDVGSAVTYRAAMTLRVVGAGLGRTGTNSLKVALERLLGEPCYHMVEVFGHLEDHVPAWHAAARGEPVDWERVFEGYAAAVDWPASAHWEQLAAVFPDAVVLLSVRPSDEWWRSASATIFPSIGGMAGTPWHDMITDTMANTFTPSLDDVEVAVAAYEAHNARVIATAPADRLVVWNTGDGWPPLCDALGLAVPDEPFPHTNSTEEFLSRHRRDGAS
jgi:hypothetical protein